MKVRKLYNDERSRYIPSARSVVVNWGSSTCPFSLAGVARVFNRPECIARASDKLVAFRALKEAKDVSIPEFTESKEEAEKWIEEGAVIVARTQLRAHSGEGIVVCSRVEDLPDCKLYTKYVKKKKEFRVHVMNGKVIDVQQKKQRVDFEGEVNYAVRNHQNGWIYAREEIVQPDGLTENAIAAVKCLGLDFGAVDIVWNERANQCYVLEVNSAPGLEGSSVDIYTNELLKIINAEQYA